MKCRAASALALVAVATVAAAAAGAGDAPAPPAGPYDNPICGTAASPCKPCNRTFRIGAPRLAAPAALGIMGKSLDFLDACFAFYDQPSGVVALDWVEAGFLDMAVVCSTSFVAAAARGAKVTVVAVPFTDIESNALVAREGLNLLSDLRHKTLWTVEGSNAHLMLLGTLQSASVDARDVTLKFSTPEGITKAWDTGDVDAAWCSGGCMGHLVRTPPPGSEMPGHVMIDAGDATAWGFPTGKAVVVSERVLQTSPDIVAHVVAYLCRSSWDYRVSQGGGRSYPWSQQVLPDGRDTAAMWQPGGAYIDVLSAYSQKGRFPAPPAAVVQGLQTAIYFTAEDQIYKIEPVLNGQEMATQLFLKKMIYDDPREVNPDAYFAGRKDVSALQAAALGPERVPLSAEPYPIVLPVPVPTEQLPVEGEGCAALSVVDVDGTYAFGDGSTGTNAYHAKLDCVWALKSPTGCVQLDISFLTSEAPGDKLMVYSSCGDLVGFFTGRMTSAVETLAGCAGDGDDHEHHGDLPKGWPVDAALYVRWRTDGFDAHGLGAIEPVGFAATAVPLEEEDDHDHHHRRLAHGHHMGHCAPGTSGAACDRPFCLGVVDVTAGGATAGIIRSQPAGAEAYAPYSRCAWRVPRREASRVVLTFVELGLENVHDHIKIYRGKPPALMGWSARFPADAKKGDRRDNYAYQFTGSRLPEAPIVVEDDVFIAFASDGLANAPRNGGPAGFEIHWSFESTLCPEASCGAHGRCVEGKCVCEPGYYGDTCAFDHCLSEALLGKTAAGRVVSGAKQDYPPATRCVWSFELPANPRGVALRFDRFDLEGPEGSGITTDKLVLYRVPDASKPDVAWGTVLASFYSTVGAAPGEPPIGTWHGPDGKFRSTFRDHDTLEVLFPTVDDKKRRLDHDTVAIALVFESDASNPTPHCGFDISYHVLHHDSMYCDANWPCPEGGLTCSDDNVCVEPKSKSNASRRVRRHRNQILMIMGIVVAVLLLLALVISLCVFAAKKKKLEMQRAFVVRDQIEGAITSVDDFQAPFACVAGDVFVGLEELVQHEVLRDRGDLFFFDSLGDVAAARRNGMVFVFLSHQWLGHFSPDPQGIHYAAMVRAVEATALKAGTTLDHLRVWVDYASVPQSNSTQQKVAINSLPSFSSCVDYFVVVAPSTRHTSTGLTCDRASFNQRCWCRAEIAGCWARNGSDVMHISTERGIERLFDGDEDPRLAAALDVFGGNLTSALCCRLGHPDAAPCDREQLVGPMLGLFHEIYRDRHEGRARAAWAVLAPRVDTCVEIKILRRVLNRRVDLHAIDATPARWRGDAGSSPLDRARTAASSPRNDLVKNCRVHPTHWLISTQVDTLYPRSFDWEFCGPEGDVVERAPLFGDLIDAARLVVDEEDLDDDGQRELARFAGFAPGTNAQRHILRPKSRGLVAKALSTFATSPRTPTRVWSTRSSSPRPSTTRSLSRSSRLPMTTGGSGSTRALSSSEESV